MLEKFESAQIATAEATIFVRWAGSGVPLLLLHGFPQTHLMWRDVAPLLARRFAVVCADLRGYGASGKPPSTPDHAPYSKSEMALDMIRVMSALGYPRFAVAGHDRGARVAYRMALEHTDHVEHLAVLDIIPGSEAFQRADSRFALSFWPWSVLSQPAPLPELLIAGAEDAIMDDALSRWGSDAGSFPPEVREAYVAALRDPETARAICEEYRAGATLDVARDRKDREAGRLIQCPTLVLWSEGGALDTWYRGAGGPLGIWRDWAVDVTGRAIPGGHFFPEANPAETQAELRAFFAR
jgi:haloacetate dehalogenase